jgi:hypothetical protein
MKTVGSARVLAVSKLQPVEKIRKLYSEGYRDFGENYPQELVRKKAELEDLSDIRWHLIGHLQKNKVKMIIGQCELIHSVDSLELAVEIDKRATAADLSQKILLQINVAGEGSKEGFDRGSIDEAFKKIISLSGIEVCGLMTMPPFVENPEDNRAYFRALRELLMELKSEFSMPLTFSELSMGTSQDYKVAAEEGATWVRLGTVLFGERSRKHP